MIAPDRDIVQVKGIVAPPGYAQHRPESTLLSTGSSPRTIPGSGIGR
jgi:hypothetical protein